MSTSVNLNILPGTQNQQQIIIRMSNVMSPMHNFSSVIILIYKKNNNINTVIINNTINELTATNQSNIPIHI